MANKIKDVQPELQSFNRLKNRVSFGTTANAKILAAIKDHARSENKKLTAIVDEALLLYMEKHGIELPQQDEQN